MGFQKRWIPEVKQVLCKVLISEIYDEVNKIINLRIIKRLITNKERGLKITQAIHSFDDIRLAHENM